MTEATNELIYDILKPTQTRLGRVEDGVRDMRTELIAMRTHMGAVQLDVGNLYQLAVSLDGRMARIERRLDLVDIPVK